MLSFVLIILLLVAPFTATQPSKATRIPTKPKPPKPKPPTEDIFATKCQKDIDMLPECSEVQRYGEVLVLLCLEKNQNALSVECSEYLGSTTVGGCNNEAQTLCSQLTDITDIINCLKLNKDKLGRACMSNINNTRSNPWIDIQEKNKHVTRAISAMSIFYLLIPFVVAIWASIKVRIFHRQQKAALVEIDRCSDDCQSITLRNPHCGISLREVSYWLKPSRHTWTSQHSSESRQILSGVCGQFQPGMHCIMGPSGSGKTTLLKLIAGQVHQGTYSGDRMINGCIFVSETYDKVMRHQAFVPQEDSLNESITVWACLTFSAMLRLPHAASLKEKLARVTFLITELGLKSCCQTLISALSGGQRRRLSVAIELLGRPAAMLLDEISSGLDSSSSLRVVRSLQRVSKSENCTIILTIHQPRAEVFSLFDTLLLLGVHGRMVYSGPTVDAAEFLSSSPAVSLKLDSYDNPGDYIIDLLGLGQSSSGEIEAEEDEITVEIKSTDTATLDDDHDSSNARRAGQEIEMVSVSLSQSSPSSSSRDIGGPVFMDAMCSHFLESSIHRDLMASIQSDINQAQIRRVSLPEVRDGRHRVAEESERGWAAWTRRIAALLTSRNTQPSTQRYNAVPHAADDETDTPIEPPSQSPQESASASLGSEAEQAEILIRKPLPFSMSLWVLFGRRLQTHAPSRSELLFFILQMLFVSIVVTYAFSYPVDSELERPYQIVMILFMISTYAMILQYLVLIPEYMTERKILIAERSSGIVGFAPYIFSAMLTEIPRAAMQSCLLVFIMYAIHPLNSTPINRLFCVVCLTCGVCAWQSLICVCAVVTNEIGIAYTLSFLALGCGGIFGGVLVRLSKIPPLLRILYYTSVTAVTQRALVVNDLQCCYISATCNSIAQSMQAPRFDDPTNNESLGGPPGMPTRTDPPNPLASFMQSHKSITFENTSIAVSSFCPPGLQVTGDGSDSGNLGRLYLSVLGLEKENPFTGLMFLFFANIVFRAVAIWLLHRRERSTYKLKKL